MDLKLTKTSLKKPGQHRLMECRSEERNGVSKLSLRNLKICSCLIMRINQWIEGGCVQEFKWKAAEIYVKCNSEDEDNDIMKTAGDWGFAEESRNWNHLKRVWLLRLLISYETSTAIYSQWIALEMTTAKDFSVWFDVPVLFTQGCGMKRYPFRVQERMF